MTADELPQLSGPEVEKRSPSSIEPILESVSPNKFKLVSNLLLLWEKTEEEQKTKICISLQGFAPKTFKYWMFISGLGKFRPQTVMQRRTEEIRQGLDSSLKKNPDALVNVLGAYFTKCDPEMNKYFLDKMKSYGFSDKMGGDPQIVEQTLEEIRQINLSELHLFLLFESTLRLAKPSWWEIDSSGNIEKNMNFSDISGRGSADTAEVLHSITEMVVDQDVQEVSNSNNGFEIVSLQKYLNLVKQIDEKFNNLSGFLGHIKTKDDLSKYIDHVAELLPLIDLYGSIVSLLKASHEKCNCIIHKSQEWRTFSRLVHLDLNISKIHENKECAQSLWNVISMDKIKVLNNREQVNHLIKVIGGNSPTWGNVEFCNQLESELLKAKQQLDIFAKKEESLKNEILSSIIMVNKNYSLNDEQYALTKNIEDECKANFNFIMTMERLKKLTEELESDPFCWRKEYLLQRLEVGDKSYNAMIALSCDWLKEGKCTLALIVLRLLQESEDEFLKQTDFDSYAKALVRAITPFVEGSSTIWLDLLRDQPWLSRLTKEDLSGSNVIRSLGGLILAAESIAPGGFSDLIINLKIPVILSTSKNLRKLAEGMATNKKWNWSTHDIGAELKNFKNRINDIVAVTFYETIKLHPRFKEELRTAKEQIEKRLLEIFSGISNSLDFAEIEEEFYAACKGDHLETHIKKEFSKELNRVIIEVDKYIHIRNVENELQGVIVARSEFFEEVKAIRNSSGIFTELWDRLIVIFQQKFEYMTYFPQHIPHEQISTRDFDFITLFPEAIARFNQNPLAKFISSDLECLISRYSNPLKIEDVINDLRISSSWDQIQILRRANQIQIPIHEQSDQLKVVLRQRINDLIAHFEVSIPDLYSALEEGRYRWVESHLQVAEKNVQAAEEIRFVDYNIQLKQIRERLRNFQDYIDDSGANDEWRQESRNIINRLLETCSLALASQKSTYEKQVEIASLERILPILETHIKYEGIDFRIFNFENEKEGSIDSSDPHLVNRQISNQHQDQGAPLEVFWRVYKSIVRQQEISSELPLSWKGQVQDFTRRFASLVQLEPDSPTSESEFILISGLRFPALSTQFLNPGSSYFARKVMVYPAPGKSPIQADIDAIVETINMDSDDAYHIVLLTSNSEDIDKQIEMMVHNADVTVFNSELIGLLHESSHPAALLRREMTIDKTTEIITPFCSEGHVERGQHVFVSRTDLMKNLRDGRCWALWGGRRSGKTTLLHALRDYYGMTSERDSAKVVYISLDSIRTLPLDSIDLSIARTICRAFKISNLPNDLQEFEALIANECEKARVCILFDEIDAYIYPHQQAKDTDFKIIRSLRGIHNSYGKQFICVFAGFKYLYHALKTTYSSDSGYPWQNWINTTNAVPRLTLEEATQIVKEGFLEILGMEYEPTVPYLLYRYTGGHAAFVQHLCNIILSRIRIQSRSKNLRITEAEVTAAYNDNFSHAGMKPFIFFVETTLGMNLSHLERIVVYIFAVSLLGTQVRISEQIKAYERLYDKTEIIDDVCKWYDLCKCKDPTMEEFDTAFSNLIMTGMLVYEDQQYRMAFGAYVDILQRLEQADSGKIFSLIQTPGEEYVG